MAQFDVFELRLSGSVVANIQSDLLDTLKTRVVVPLLPSGRSIVPAKRLNPIMTLNSETYVFAAQFLAAVQISELGKPIGSIAEYQDEITAALDMLYQGF